MDVTWLVTICVAIGIFIGFTSGAALTMIMLKSLAREWIADPQKRVMFFRYIYAEHQTEEK